MSVDYFLKFYKENQRYPTFEEYENKMTKSVKSKEISLEELKKKYNELLEKSISKFVEKKREKALEITKNLIPFLINAKSRNLRRTPGFNYRNLPTLELSRFKAYFDDMKKNTIEATDTNNRQLAYKITNPNLPKVIKIIGKNSYMLGDVVHAVRSTLIRKALGDEAVKKTEEIDKIKNNPDISDDNKKALIDVVINDMVKESVDSIMMLDEADRVEILQQQMEGNTTSSISNPENSINYSANISEEIKETIFNEPEVSALIGLSISLPVKEIYQLLPDKFTNYIPFLPNDPIPDVLPNDPIPDVLPTGSFFNEELDVLPFWTDRKIAIIGGIAGLLAASSLAWYFSQKSEMDKKELDLLMTDEEFEKKKKDGYIPLEASKAEFLEAFHLISSDNLNEFDESKNARLLMIEAENRLILLANKEYKDLTYADFPGLVWTVIKNMFSTPGTYDIPEPFIKPYKITHPNISVIPPIFKNLEFNTCPLLAPPQDFPIPESLKVISNIPKPDIALLAPPPLRYDRLDDNAPVLNNNYTQNNLRNIMSFQTPYKTYEDLPEYMRVFITREEFNAAMSNKGTINDLILKKNGYNDGRNNILSAPLPRVPSEKIPIRREGKFLSSFPAAYPNSTPKSFPREGDQGIIGTGTQLRKGDGSKYTTVVKYFKERDRDNVGLIGSETRLIKKVKKIPLY